jgi:hypothetical protein
MENVMSEEIINNLGPLAPLAGVWESDQGIDTSRVHSTETITEFREKIVDETRGDTFSAAAVDKQYSQIPTRPTPAP